jgi:dihydroorotate dehydrogenase
VWYPAARRALFALDPELAHRLAIGALRIAGCMRSTLQESSPITCMGLHFANPVGLAAGFDKDAVALGGLGRLGFGFVEVGTVTPRPQPGQPRPRLFRLRDAEALINRLGFPSDGAQAVATRLRQRRYRGVVGVNIGKNADTPHERTVDDYVHAFRVLRDVADYIVVNVSSPNTAELRALQAPESLTPLLSALMEERARPNARHSTPPILVKISPDLDRSQLLAISQLVKALSIDGVVATNTTVGRAGLADGERHGAESGGLSGPPLHAIALRTVSTLRALLGHVFPIIGVGGINSAATALAMRAAGASLIQLYTGLVYRGPELVGSCVRALAESRRTTA